MTQIQRMPGMAMGVSPETRFGQRSKDPVKPLKDSGKRLIDQKVADFSRGLQALVQVDSQDTQPVFSTLDQPRVVSQIKTLLTRQMSRGENPTPMIIAMAGGSNSGKTTLMNSFLGQIQETSQTTHQWDKDKHGPVVDVLELDNFYRNFEETRKQLGDERFFGETNLDEPAALETDAYYRALMKIKNGHAVRSPLYNFINSSRKEGVALKVPSPFFVFEGLFALAHEQVRKLADLKIFVDCDQDTRSKRFWNRAPQRNIKPDQSGWNLHNKTMAMHDVHVQPTSAHADIVINGARPKEVIESRLKPLVELVVRTVYPQPNLHEHHEAPTESWTRRVLLFPLRWFRRKQSA